MIYRYSQKFIRDDELLKRIENGEKIDFDSLWTTKRRNKEREDIDIYTSYHHRWGLFEKGECALLVAGGLITAGIWPVVDTVVHVMKKAQKKYLDNLDSQNNIIAVSADEVLFFADKIKAKVLELAKQGHRVNVVIDGCAQTEWLMENQRIEYNFDTQKLLKLIDLQSELQKVGMTEPIKFNEFFQTTKYSDLKTCWTLEQVIDANNKIDNIVRRIQDLKLSPYETMIYIHKYLTQNFEYGFHTLKISDMLVGTHRKTERNRSIVAALQDNKTICAGYASMTKAIIDRLNIPGLKCDYQNASVWNKKKKCIGGHALTLVTIEDSKYNINGSYLNDATWDSKNKEHPQGRGYTYFMYPVTDMSKLSKIILSIADGSRTQLSLYSREKFIGNPSKGEDSVPIPYDTFEKAVKRVYSLESDFCRGKEPEQAVTQDIQLSLKRAWNSRIDDANPLVKQVDVVYTVSPKYNKKHKLKNVKFELKNEVVNANRGMEQ